MTGSTESNISWKANSYELLKKFPAFYKARRLIILFMKAHHWPLSWAKLIQSTHSLLILILILSFQIGRSLHCVVFPLQFTAASSCVISLRSKILWHINPLLSNARNTQAANNTGAVFPLCPWWHHTTTMRSGHMICVFCDAYPCRIYISEQNSEEVSGRSTAIS
jgi:hypothetical protein